MTVKKVRVFFSPEEGGKIQKHNGNKNVRLVNDISQIYLFYRKRNWTSERFPI